MHIWANTYRPRSLEDYIFQDKNQQNKFQEYWDNKSFPNLLLSGAPGTGKSTIARMLAVRCADDSSDIKIINASKDNNVDFIRSVITDFIQNFSVGQYKIVLLEEADYLSLSAQAVLRTLTEDFTSSVRFILTCNYPNKIMAPLKSRFTHYSFRELPYQDIMVRLVNILKTENIEPNLDVIEHCIDSGYPDMRQIITHLQDSVKDNVLVMKKLDSSVDWQSDILDLISKGNFKDIKHLVETTISENDLEELYELMYKNIHIFFTSNEKWCNAQLLIADHLYKHSIVSKPQINASALMINLMRV